VSPSRCVLLDRDGVLNVDRPRGTLGLGELAMLPGSAAAVARLTAAGYRVLVVTNQGPVGRGELSREELERINAAIAEAVATAGGRIDAWYVCPHRAEDGCDCRKPAPGLLLRARDEWGFEPAATWFVGDATRDADAAVAAGCRPLVVRTGKGGTTLRERPALPAVDDLAAAVAVILDGEAAEAGQDRGKEAP